MEKISFKDTKTGMDVDFYVVEQTTFGGNDYLLVTDLDPDDENAVAYFFRAQKSDDADVIYEEVEDEKERSILARLFEELLEDTSIV